MTDNQDNGKKKTLSLSGVSSVGEKKKSDSIRQSFSHGRSKPVAVEVRKRRQNKKSAEDKAAKDAKLEKLRLALEQEKNRTESPQAKLIREQQEAIHKEREAQVKSDVEKRRQDEEKAAAEAKAKAEAAEKAVAEAKAKPTQTDGKKPEAKKPSHKSSDAKSATSPQAATLSPSADRKPHKKKSFKDDDRKSAKPKTMDRGRRDRYGGSDRQRSLSSLRRAKQKQKHAAPIEYKKIIQEVVLPETITVQELASRMAERAADVIKSLMEMGVMATINQTIEADTAELIISEFGHTCKRVQDSDVEDCLKLDEDPENSLIDRAPVVTVMGHVDHGKTSLLDALRRSDVVTGEAGGITQHIGASCITAPSGAIITFIDTPGHAAFSEMRARGANVTDIVILVVAANDGVKEQTIEALRHAQAAEVPIVVAINKIDLPGADSMRVKTELLNYEIATEDMGGEVICVEVSAKQQLNLDGLLESVLLQSEMLDLKANPKRQAVGTVVESRLEKGRGAVSTVLVQRGTLSVGDIFVSGCEFGRVRALIDDKGHKIKTAGPSVPAEVLGFNGIPLAGDDFVVVNSESQAREVVEYRQNKERDRKNLAQQRSSLEEMMSQAKEGEVKELSVVIKSDVHGSAEAIATSLQRLSNDEVRIRVIHSAVGGINESDIALASASKALVIGFNVRANPQARDLARSEHIEMRYYSIIYDVINDVKAVLQGLLDPILRESFLGNADIRTVFTITKVGRVAGCMVTKGIVKRGARIRLLRDDIVIHEGDLKTLKRFKDDQKEVKEGYECGIVIENFQDVKEGDMIECFEILEEQATL
jgi:translation initiation factor IF-2